MRTLYVWLVVMALVMMGIQAQAYPDLNATTGLQAIPTAGVVAPGDFIGATDALFHINTTCNGRVIYGLTDRLEIGAGVIAGKNRAISMNAKLALPSNIAGFHTALGITYLNGQAIHAGTQLYLVATRAFMGKDASTEGVIGTIGINYTAIDTASAFRPFVGMQCRVGTRAEVGGECVVKSGNFITSVISIPSYQNESPLVDPGRLSNDNGFSGSTDHNLHLGAAYSLGNNAL